MSIALRLDVLGKLRVLRDGQPLALPPSRKTRAALGYLALTARPHRRERLCQMFWELPDDPPRPAALALGKIRARLNDRDRARVEAPAAAGRPRARPCSRAGRIAWKPARVFGTASVVFRGAATAAGGNEYGAQAGAGATVW